MKKSFSLVLSIAALTALSITSCKKATQNFGGDPPGTGSTKNIIHFAGIGSNHGYPASYQTDYARYQLYGTSTGQLGLSTYSFGGPATSTDPNGVRGFATSQSTLVFAYRETGVNILNVNGTEFPILTPDYQDVATYIIEEIEMDPTNDQYVYLLVREVLSIRMYRFDCYTGSCQPMLYEYSPGFTTYNLYGNIFTSGYQSGSIAFVKGTIADPNAYRLVFTHESNTYSSLGIVTTHLLVSGTDLSPEGGTYNKTYSTATSGIPGALTGKLNTAYGDGVFYIARDGGNLYSLDINNSNTAATQIASSAQFNNKYDFSYYDNYNH